MVNQSGLLEDPEYQRYERYAEEGKLDNDGYYKEYIVKLGELKLRNTSYTEKLMRKCF
jgi:hypothetical protein